jgi:holliday junction DNA helicase RuvA
MIYFLQGLIHSKLPTFVILNVNGVGYGINVSANTTASLPGVGEKTQLIIHHHITEMSQTLFGFADEQEKALFELLITVKGIGPKMGISILSGMSGSQIQESIAKADLVMLSRIPGIGKKTAERIVLELKDKMGFQTSSSVVGSTESSSVLAQDAISGLLSLGYKQLDAVKHVSDCVKSGVTYKNASDLLRDALKRLNS